MSQTNHWTTLHQRRISRRTMLSASARAGVGAAGLALVGCGDDDDDDDAAVAQAEDQAEEQAEQAEEQAEEQAQAEQAVEDEEAEEQAEEQAEQVEEQEEQAEQAEEEQAEEQAVAADSTDFDRTVRIAIPNAVGGLDPQAAGNYTTTFNPIQHFDRLLTRDLGTQDLLPLAASWEWVDANTAGVFHLKDGMTWHDGAPVTAEDIKFSIERLRGIGPYNDDGVYATGADYVVAAVNDEVTVTDASTIRVPTEVDVTAQASIGFLPLVPKHQIEDVGDAAFNQDAFGGGYFKLKSYTPDEEVVSERFDDYHVDFDESENIHKPWIKEFRQIVRPEPVARVAALEAGEVDLVTRIEVELTADFEDRDEFTVLFDPGCCPHYIFPNTLVPLADGSNPFQDIRVRQAMNHAIDVDLIIQTLGTGQERRGYGISSRQLGAMTLEQATPLTYEYNPEKARALLAEAGFPDGFDTPFYGTVGFFAATDTVAQTVAQMLAAVGIRTELQLDPLPDFRARFAQKDVPGLHYYFGNQSPDPISVINAEVAEGGTLATAMYPESGIQELVEAQRLEFDGVKREAILNELAQKIYTNANWIFLYETVETGVMRSDLAWDVKGNTRDHRYYWAIRPLAT